MRYLKFLSIICFSIFFVTEISAQKLGITRLNSEDGLSNNLVGCIIQDKKGFIWIGTRDGLNRFDGHTIKIYKKDEADKGTILDNYIISLFEDSRGELWVGTLNGMSRYNRETDDFTSFRISTAEAEGFKKETLGAIAEDAEGNMWFGNQNGGIYKLNPSSGKYVYYDYPNTSISELYIDDHNNLFAGTINSEIYYFDRKANTFIRSDLPSLNNQYIPDNYVRNIFQDSRGNLIMNASHGIFEIDPLKGDVNDLTIIPTGFSGFRNNEIRYVFEESPDLLWIGTWGKGLYRYHKSKGELMNYQVEPNNENSLSNNDVNYIYKDRGGVIWICTQEGLSIIDPAKDIFRKYQNNPADPQSLHFNFITSFCEDIKNNIWIGTYGAGISIFNSTEEKFSTLLHDPLNMNSLINNAVRAIREDKYGHIWIGTMQGLDSYDPSTGKFTHYQHDPDNSNSLSNNDVMCIINGNNNDLWVGTFGGGITHIQLSGNSDPQFTNIRNIPGDTNSLSSNYIRSLMMDRYGNLWVGSLGSGVDMIEQKTDEIIHYYGDAVDSGGLANNRINCLYEGQDGNIWIGTWGGLSLFERESNNFINYTIADGLPDNNISEIQQDEQGSLWVSTFKGMVKIDYTNRGDIRLVKYTTHNGLQGNKFNINASLKDSKGNIYFGGTTGFNIIDPSKMISNDYVPPVVLTDLLVFNQPVKVNEKLNGRIILEKSISETEEITLSHKDKILSIEFAALSFSEKEKNTYMYYLEGVDKEWVTVDSKRRFATYSNLPMGRYTFRVKAANSDGVWNDEGAVLMIRILPPPWKTWWAFLIYATVIVSGLLIIRHYTIRQAFLKHQIELEEVERQKTEELNQLKFSFFTNISHEVKTPLTLILGPLEKLLDEPHLSSHVKDHLYMMNRNSKRLMNLVNQLMDFRKIEKGKLELEFSESDIVGFVRNIKEAFNGLAKEHQIQYEFNTGFKSKMLWFDHNKLEMAIYNILSNAFKFTNDQGKIVVDIHSTEKTKGLNILKKLTKKEEHGEQESSDLRKFVMITISDNGIGIPKDRLNRIFERFYQVNSGYRNRQNINQTGTGIGLSITRDIVMLHKGRIDVESQYGRGSKFYIFLPLGDNHIPENQKINHETQQISETASIDSVLVADNPEYQYIQNEQKLEEESSGEKLKVLVVEDNHDIRSFICSAVADNFNVAEAENGVEGFESAVKDLPDLIISDIMMPVMDGLELCKKVKEDIRTSHIPVILLTAYNTVQNNIRGYEEGADEYVAKPFNARLLNARIKNLIENRKRLRELFSSDLAINPRKITVTNTDTVFLEKAVKIVEERMDDPEFNVVTFGRELCMSRTNLFRKMKSLTNLSASEFIRIVKMKQAARLLLEGHNVAQVMDKVGISSRSYFNKCFYEQFNKTPSEYIKEYLA